MDSGIRSGMGMGIGYGYKIWVLGIRFGYGINGSYVIGIWVDCFSRSVKEVKLTKIL